ncbi:hypothetical protein SAMN06265795_105164 [Noviherbaspirillum humi]|uniref:Lipoprotein n=1 Tax=Noviherbaspirillum humi TaxID=1688639 RepID=A0A239GRN6_9BURK|nr:hypothetical protein [Noviherbaspirillum humi]SNS71807.1 hypothetical protein SAMN06265795_105164 [Noviherbaspirillum humi]
MPKLLPSALLALSILAGCATHGSDRTRADSGVAAPSTSVIPVPGQITIQDREGAAVLEKVQPHVGVSSNVVEKLAHAQGCMSEKGAGLITQKGPVEIYRMQCDDGRVFNARCELRQCGPLR